MCRLMFGLREIRNSVESLPPEPTVQAPSSFAIVSVPSGFAVGADGGFTPMPLMIEHDPQPPLRLDERIIEAAPEEGIVSRSSDDEDRIINELKSQINELARKSGVSVVV